MRRLQTAAEPNVSKGKKMPGSKSESEVEIEDIELAQAIGELAIQFGRLESSVSELVITAFGKADMESANAVSAVLSFRQKLDLVAALAPSRLTNSEHLEEVQSCIATLQRYEEKRNSLLHAFWGRELVNDYPFAGELIQSRTRAHRKKGLVHIRNEVNLTEIRALSKEIQQFRGIFGQKGSLYYCAVLMLEASKNKS
jgi:hypothetical protein